MSETFCLSLKMFASRFGLDIEELAWGIRIIDKKEKQDFDFSPVILIKDKQGYISIEDDRLEPKLFPTLEYIFEPATLEEDINHTNYIFKSANAKIYLKKESVDKFYAAKFYSSNTEKYIFGD